MVSRVISNFTTFADFESAFASRFGASDIDLSYSRRQFRRFPQRDSDSVSKFHSALLDLVARISLSGKLPSDDDVIEQFVNGLKPDLSDLVFHEQIRAGRTYSLDELVKIAEDIERSERSKRQPNNTRGVRRTSTQCSIQAGGVYITKVTLTTLMIVSV